MGIKGFVIKPFAKKIAREVRNWSEDAVGAQQRVFRHLIAKGQHTSFGREHGFEAIFKYEDFREKVPVRDYEAFKPYIDRIVAPEENVLWPGMPVYMAKTSGTTSGTKYIPLTKDSMPNHMNTARNALMCFVAETNDASVFDGKLMFISGSPKLYRENSVLIGRLSGIVNHHVPAWIKTSQLPSFQTNSIEDFELKIDRIVAETLGQDMRMISGIPPWVMMYFEKIMEKTGKPVIEVFPNFKVFIHGGVNFKPYREKMMAAIGREIPVIETFPASEGFIAFQDSQQAEGMLLNVDSGIFFEFIPAGETDSENPARIPLGEVELGKNYALVLSNNAGLWAYGIGDIVKFVSVNPYRIVVAGRTKHFISAFGEHVIGEEVEKALIETCLEHGCRFAEFTVAPQVNPEGGQLPHHEWFVDFDQEPENSIGFAHDLDEALQRHNSYYKDLIKGRVLQTLKLNILQKNAFNRYMKSEGKLGGQNKLPRLKNDRSIADKLADYIRKRI